MLPAVSTNVWYFGAAGLISLIAFVVLILVPAMTSYGRWPERLAAGFLSLIIFGSLVVIGVVAGLVYLLLAEDISDVFPWSGE